MTTQAIQDQAKIYDIIRTATTNTSLSVFSNIARVIVCWKFAEETGEVYGAGMPRANRAIKALLDAKKIARKDVGGKVYYSIP